MNSCSRKNNQEFNYRRYSRAVLFDPFFWLHLLLEVLFLLSPLLLFWKLILLGVVLLELQFFALNGCLINKWHFPNDKEAVFLYPYLRMLGVNISYRHSKILMRYVVPVIILLLALFWQVVKGREALLG